MRNFDNCLNILIHDLKGSKRLSAEETVDLLSLYQKTGDKKLLNDIIIGNIWFLISRAKRYTNRYLSVSDLIYSGILGMIRAAKKFDSSREIKFITYASYWIEMYMRREVIYNSSIVKMTPRMWGMASVVTKMRGDGASEEDILSKLKIGKNTLRKLRNTHIDLSLNSFLTDDPDSDELEKIILVDNKTPADICLENDETNYLASSVKKLKKREREIIEHKFGLSGYTSQNLKEISKSEEVSTERVRQILKNGLKNLKKSLSRKDFC